MRRFVGVLAAMATLAIMASGAAFAQEADPSGLTSLEPLTRIVERFAAGDEIDGLYLQSETGAGPTGLSQFQVIVNLGGGTSFLDVGVEMVPSGLSADGNLVSLEEQFDGTLSSSLPPLAPYARDRTELAMDLTAVFEGWTAYSGQGLIEGPIEIREGVMVVAGIELAEPYDPECSETTYVGRAWVGSTVSAPDPLFSTEALTDEYRGANHSALAGRASRLIELVCVPGFGPQLLSFRMKEDGGISLFGPFEMFALVKGSHVVLIVPIRVLDVDLTQRFYASPPGGGEVVVSEIENEPRLLVPNPYGPNDVRVDLRVVSPPADTDAANAVGNAGETRTLLYQEDTGAIVPVQSGGGCDLWGAVLFVLGFVSEGRDHMDIFAPTSSASGPVETRDDALTSTMNDASGEIQTVTLKNDGTGDVKKTATDGSECVANVEYTTTPDVSLGDGDSADDGTAGSASDEDGDSGGETESGGTDTTSGGDGGGFDLLDLGLFGFLAAVILAAFWGLYSFSNRPKIYHRLDPGDAGVYIDEADDDPGDDDDEAGGPDTGPATTDDPGVPR